jgi:hypothetical protein
MRIDYAKRQKVPSKEAIKKGLKENGYSLCWTLNYETPRRFHSH